MKYMGFLFADDATLTIHSAEDLQHPHNRFCEVYSYFGLKISHKKDWEMTWTAQPTSESLITIWKMSITLCFNDLKPTLKTELNKY